jgi:hypothetical protein
MMTMSDDKTLLELAAKAAGIDHRRLPDAWPNRFDDDQWNPLIDDGDALRLAVKLNLSLSTGPCIVKCNSISGALRGNFINEDSIYQDRYAANRRAIVRAAAAIGESM